MTRPGILAAGRAGPGGFGAKESGLRPWPAELRRAFTNAELKDLHWSLVSDTDPGRFGRMDLLSRVGLMAVEAMRWDFASMPQSDRDQTAVLVESSTGCLRADLDFLRAPRASSFSYTLPSAVIGEICIRHKLRGPVLCVINPARGASEIIKEASRWIERGDAKYCLALSLDAVDRETAAAVSAPDWPCALWSGTALLLGGGGPLESEIWNSNSPPTCLPGIR
jgi:3-oxoacyl-(acyl-carrier-protein) synthase